ncbi:hypothetical protein F5Y16DRAFT_405537 [Xylariaceae sp. FL0255]|nr:hypothetical protein F5Y16DRAFT_405537 [Xylariaceae sp. FL0255]
MLALGPSANIAEPSPAPAPTLPFRLTSTLLPAAPIAADTVGAAEPNLHKYKSPKFMMKHTHILFISHLGSYQVCTGAKFASEVFLEDFKMRLSTQRGQTIG